MRDKKPFDELVEGLSHCGDLSCDIVMGSGVEGFPSSWRLGANRPAVRKNAKKIEMVENPSKNIRRTGLFI